MIPLIFSHLIIAGFLGEIMFKYIPDVPSFTDEQLKECSRQKDYRPILFEWYKFVGSLCAVILHILPESPAFKEMPRQHFHILVGLLNRCTRLMISNVALSHEGKFGEATSIIDRCILESALKVTWLCGSSDPDRFVRYLSDGLKTELELQSIIQSNIKANGGYVLPIEERMLKSIKNHISAAQISESEVTRAKKFPALSSILTEMGFSRLFYVVVNKIGSHHVHGTWPSLVLHYLKADDGIGDLKFVPNVEVCETHENQFSFVPLIMLETMSEYISYILGDESDEAEYFQELFKSTYQAIMEIVELSSK